MPRFETEKSFPVIFKKMPQTENIRGDRFEIKKEIRKLASTVVKWLDHGRCISKLFKVFRCRPRFESLR